jgi:hypothetical protein
MPFRTLAIAPSPGSWITLDAPTIVARSNIVLAHPNGAATQGRAYLIKRGGEATPSPIRMTGTAATSVKTLGSRTIGIP